MKIISFSANTFWKGEVKAEGEIEDKNFTYRTSITIKGSQLTDYSCSCIEEKSKNGCSHAKFIYNEFLERSREKAKVSVSTDASVRTMIREYTNRSVARIVNEEEDLNVRLEPVLVDSREGISIEYRIKGGMEISSNGEIRYTGREYLIKDIDGFAEAVRKGKLVKYGKDLNFEHSTAAFSADSQEILRLILEETDSYKTHFLEIKRGSQPLPPARRSIRLSPAAVDSFFKAVAGRKILTCDRFGLEQFVTVADENPYFTINVDRSYSDGIKVSLPDKLKAFFGESGLYVWYEKCIYRCDEEYTELLSIFLRESLNTEAMPVTRGKGFSFAVNDRDVPLFYGRVLRKLDEYGLIKTDGIDWESFETPELSAKFSFDTDGKGSIVMVPELGYGEITFHPLEDDKLPKNICRDVPEEFRINRLISKFFEYGSDGTLVLKEKGDYGIYRLLTEGMERFRELGEVFVSETFRNFKVKAAPTVSWGVTVSGGWLSLDLDTGGLTASELFKILQEYRQRKHFYRMKSGEFLDLESDGLAAFAKLAEGLDLSKNDLQDNNLKLPMFRAFYLDELMRENQHVHFNRDEIFRNLVRDLKNAEDFNCTIPEGMEDTLREYQKNGYYWLKMLEHYGFGGILADDMGLGKTIQSIALINSERDGQSLIVCPASLIYNWEHEFEMYAPGLKTQVITGQAAERKRILENSADADVLITSYDLLKRDIDLYSEKKFNFEIIDEAQVIKNAGTLGARAVKRIDARRRFALTGTPVENRPGELWSIFDFLMPGFLYSYRRFRTMFEVPMVKDGDRMAMARLSEMIRPFVLRRKKSDVLKELPPKVERIIYSAQEGREREVYLAENELLRNRLLGMGELSPTGRIEILSGITRLRQICDSPELVYDNYNSGSAKLETTIALIKNAVESGHKLLLFSQFVTMLNVIAARLDSEGINYHMLTGQTPKEERNRMVTSYASDDIQVFLISLKAGGTGLNLTAADIVIHYDPWWNGAVELQATDRAHRIGQKKQVIVYKMIMKQTIEENIMKLQATKKELSDVLISEGDIVPGALTKEELIRVLQ